MREISIKMNLKFSILKSLHVGVLVLSTVLIMGVDYAQSEVFTALTDMEELLETEAVLINNLEGYIKIQEGKMDYLKKKVNEYQKEHEEASADISEYLANPINAYLLTKRLTSDWKQIENLMEYDVGTEFLDNITNYREVLKFPTDEDLNGAAVALMRLQDTYNLDTSSVARGELNGVQYSTEMTSNDCFELGRQSYMNGDFYHTKLWMNEAMDRLKAEHNRTYYSDISKADILEYLAFSVYKEGDVVTALNMTNELLTLMPDHERALGNKGYYEKEVAELKRKRKGDDGNSPFADILQSIRLKTNSYLYDEKERKKYEMLCRGELSPTPAQMRPLRCRYVDHGNPALRISPFKVEEASLDPYIVIFHEVMHDDEIEYVKKSAKPRFKRATVQNSKTGELETANYRISKSAWLRDNEHRHIKNIVARAGLLTNLNMETAEELQVVNYGIGGHYEPHFDFARKEETNAFKDLNTGNRIATLLFYMSDVEQGGATVFPTIQTALFPKKGTAAFWYNLFASGEGDYRTRHAACPVLLGSKWVSNKWIHERGQEHHRPCGLKPDHPPEYDEE